MVAVESRRWWVRCSDGAPQPRLTVSCASRVRDSTTVHLVSTLGPSHSALDGYPETGSEGESLTTPSESVASGPEP
jgi:hypothetical protein